MCVCACVLVRVSVCACASVCVIASMREFVRLCVCVIIISLRNLRMLNLCQYYENGARVSLEISMSLIEYQLKQAGPRISIRQRMRRRLY